MGLAWLSMTKRILISLIAAGVLAVGGTSLAAADAPDGNSGHSDAASHQCQNGVDHCPPFGP